MKIANQFRLVAIPKEKYSINDLLNIIRSNSNIIEDRGEYVIIKYRYGLNLSNQWTVFIEETRHGYDLVIENFENPSTTIGWAAKYIVHSSSALQASSS
jgi:hypothetical protein